MKHLQYIAFTALFVGLLAGSAAAQKKPIKKPVAKKPAVTKTIIPPLDVRAARAKVTTQRDNVNLFVDKLGPIALGIESLDASAKTRPLPKAAADRNEANKRNVVAAIRNLRSGLADLESEFRTKTVLAKYLPSIQGITVLATQSEDAAIAGKFVVAKEPLRAVAQKLTDTLAVLPK